MKKTKKQQQIDHIIELIEQGVKLEQLKNELRKLHKIGVQDAKENLLAHMKKDIFSKRNLI